MALLKTVGPRPEETLEAPRERRRHESGTHAIERLRAPGYCAFVDGALVRHCEPSRAPTALEEFVHDSFRSLVLNPKFSCVAAKSAIRSGSYRVGTYGAMGSASATASLARDLAAFAQERPSMGEGFSTYVASFDDPIARTELEFERALWQQLQSLHEVDAETHRWDPSVSDDPHDASFSFSVGGTGFFVVALHPTASRFARRFAFPTLVFNAHEQFEALREAKKYERMQTVIRARELDLQGSVNSNLTDFGERSEARQYGGRAVEEAWRCPFHAVRKEQ